MLIEHIAFNVPEPAAAATWYVSHLGLRVVRSQTVSPFAQFLVDESDRSVIEFYNNPGDPVPDLRAVHPLRHHIAFATDDIAVTWALLIAAGAQAVDEIVTTPIGDRLVFLRDPWGLPLQLVQRAKPLLA
ncbi:MAG: VOC family protein [Anaerolineales bacterium]|nr:VOC family protein [Anaerolineales bacterium]